VSVRYCAFGDMAVIVDGERQALTRRRERAVLAVLLAVRGAPVAADRLVAEVWGDEAPSQTLAALQVAVSRLRSLLEPERKIRSGTRLVSTAAGYALRAASDDVDTWMFQAVAEEALAAESPEERLSLCDAARTLWVAAPYSDNDAPLVRAETDRLEELLLTVHEHRARALLDLGRPEEAQRALAELAPQQPFREQMWALLALAQYQSSRQADALATLRTLRERLSDELGVDPSEGVRALEQGVLRQDPSLGLTRPAPVQRAKLSRPTVSTRVPGLAEEESASVGRDVVLSRLLGIHKAAIDQRRPAFVLVAGEPGIGKSRLVDDLRAAASADGSTTLVGHCLEGEYAPALWPWLSVVRPLAAAHEVDPLLEPLLGESSAATQSGSGTTLRMFDAVVDLLASVSREQPVLVVLEDVHWADASSLLLLRHLAASPPAGPLTVVCTRRTTEAVTDQALVDAMADLARAGAERVRLDGVDDGVVRTLLDRAVGAHDPRLDTFVTEVSGGNPFFVLQYAQLLGATPDLANLDPTLLPVPDGVRDVMRQRVARLPQEAARLLVCASVLGRHVDPEELAELTSVPVDDCLDQLDLALASGLMEEEDSAYAFVHALARETLRSELSAARRMRLHDRAGRIIEARTAGGADAAAEIAYHAHVAAPLGAEQAARACEWLARAAAVAVSRQAHPEALGLWDQVLANTTPTSLTAATAQRGRSAALIRLGRMTEAHAALDAAVDIASAHDEWAMVAETATVLSGAGPWSWREHGVVHAPLVDVLTTALPHVPSDLQARLLAILQMEHFYGWKSTIVEEYGQRSVALARESGDIDLLRDVLMLRLIASTGSWHATQRLAVVEELLALDPKGELEVTALFYLGQIRWDCGDPDGADEAMQRCRDAAAEVRHTGLDIPLRWWQAARQRDTDDPGHGALLDEVMETHREVGYVASRELECLYAIRRSRVGSPVSDETVELAERGGMPLRALVAHALLESGDAQRAASLLGEPASLEVVDYCSTAGRCLRLLVLCSVGTPEEIREALLPLEGHLSAPVSYGTIDHLGSVDHFVAAAYAALADPRAVDVARSAVAANRRLTCMPWLRRSETLLASLGG
jgi:DNA-binding SARP family transcriptional activator